MSHKHFHMVPVHISVTLGLHFKGTVQRELRWVKIGINRTARINCFAGKCNFQCPKGHHHESIINVLGGCSTFWRHPNRLGQYTWQRRTNSVTASVLRRCSCAASEYPKMLWEKVAMVITAAVLRRYNCVKVGFANFLHFISHIFYRLI